MLCEKCKNNQATIFYEETVNGRTRSYSLCSDCASKLEAEGTIHLPGGPGEGYFSLPSHGGLSDGLFGTLFGLSEPIRTVQKSCPLCHATPSDFRREGKMGCPACYTAFASELDGTIRSIHGNVRHVGHAPSRFEKQNERKNRIAELKKRLGEAVAAEKFEEAAKLRDSLRALEAENEERK